MKKSLRHAAQRIRLSIDIHYRLLLIGILLLLILGSSNVKSVGSNFFEKKGLITGEDIHLILQSGKFRYRGGEPIALTSYLINVSEKNYYVGGRFSSGFLGTSELHDFELKVVDISGKEINILRSAGAWVWKPDTSVRNKIEQAYIVLGPGNVHGISEKLDLGLRPGRYRLQVSYKEEEALTWDQQELQNLSFPVWTEHLSSNVVEISVAETH